MTGPNSLSRSRSDKVRREAHEWRLLMSSGHATQDDEKRFEAWLQEDASNHEYFDFANTFWDALGHIRPSDLNSETLQPSFAERFVGVFKVEFHALHWGAIAAASAVAAIVALTLPWGVSSGPTVPAQTHIASNFVSYSSERGIIRELALSDGSYVTLGADTTIETDFSQAKRDIKLVRGVAFFDVAPDSKRPLSVHSDDLTVIAIGTQFEVGRRAGVHRAEVAEGIVEVSYPLILDGVASSLMSKREVLAGQKVSATASNGLMPTADVRVELIGSWRQDRFVYSAHSVGEIIADINRYSETVVIIEEGAGALADLQVRGTFEAQNVDGLLNTLAEIHPIEIDRSEPGTVVLRQK